MSNLLEQLIKKSLYHNLKERKFNDVTWKTQESTKGHILFYRLANTSDKVIQQFLDRIKGIQYGCIITNHYSEKLEKIANLLVVAESEWMPMQKLVMDEFYPISKDINIFGITGTNGKTTSVDLMSQLASFYNVSHITIGTLGLYCNRTKELDFALTSPSFIDLRKYLCVYGKTYKYFFIEASSHALEQGRFFGLEFFASAWTSFSQDHLDYHGDMETYFRAKSKILEHTPNRKVYVSSRSTNILEKLDPNKVIVCEKVDKSLKNPFFKADYNLINLEIAFTLIKTIIPTVNNCHFEKLTAPPGRFHIIEFKESYIVIDFAHTPDALENICASLKKSFSEKKLVTVFGCGGDRDRSKRPIMAKACEKYSDHIVVTSDNPRFEDPQTIINDIVMGFCSKNYDIFLDREEAIYFALKSFSSSIILIAGKGHEDYLDIKGTKIAYSDEKIVRKYINDQSSKN